MTQPNQSQRPVRSEYDAARALAERAAERARWAAILGSKK